MCLESIDQRGSSLMQVMIAIAVMGVVVAGMTAFLEHGNREARSLQQKLEIQQSQLDLTRDLSDSAICACNFDPNINTADASALRFNLNNPDSSISVSQIYGSCIGGVPGNPVLRVGQPVAASQAGLVVESIMVRKFNATGTGRYRADLEVVFDRTRLNIERRPASVGLSVQVDTSNPAQARITGCTAGANGGGNGGGFGSVMTCPDTTVNWWGGMVDLPEAPLGTYLINGSFTVLPPDCSSFSAGGGASGFLCDYASGSTTSAPNTAWRSWSISCPFYDSPGP